MTPRLRWFSRDRLVAAEQRHGYQPRPVGWEGRLGPEVPRRDAEVIERLTLDSLNERVAEISDLAVREGIDLAADDWLLQFERWCSRNAMFDSTDNRRLTGLWLSIATDLGLYWGERLRADAPSLVWAFDDDPRSVEYLRPVLRGFPPDEDTGISVDLSTCQRVAAACLQYANGIPFHEPGVWQRTDRFARLDLGLLDWSP